MMVPSSIAPSPGLGSELIIQNKTWIAQLCSAPDIHQSFGRKLFLVRHQFTSSTIPASRAATHKCAVREMICSVVMFRKSVSR